jgi:hypothetical protein
MDSRTTALLALITCSLFAGWSHARKQDPAIQANLDAVCETARQKQIAIDRDFLIEECMEKKTKKDLESCQRFYADHGNQSGTRGPLYYDLSECVEAFDNKQANR